MARAPNEVWSWDITRLLGPQKGQYFYLHVILDIYSRYATGWMVAQRETAGLAGHLVSETCLKHGVQPQVLTLHSDRGSPMTAKCTAQLLADLGITQSLGRPRVSNDNPYSEAHFKTIKYHPGFPGRFGSIEEAKDFCRGFFQWYNTEHRHGGIGLLTPEQVHFGRAPKVIENRRQVLAAAYVARPDRFVKGPPKAAELPDEIWINRALSVTSVVGAEPVNRGKGGLTSTKLNRNMSQICWQAPIPLLQTQVHMLLSRIPLGHREPDPKEDISKSVRHIHFRCPLTTRSFVASLTVRVVSFPVLGMAGLLKTSPTLGSWWNNSPQRRVFYHDQA